MGRCIRIDPSCFTESIPDFVASSQSAGERAANADTYFTSCLLTEPRVERHKFQDVDRLKLKTIRDPIYTAVINESEMVLPEMEQRKRGAPLGDGVVSYRLIDLGKKVRRDLVGLAGSVGRCSMLVHEGE